jgi:hypothetical protein
MNALETTRTGWLALRSVTSTALDWPTTANSYNPATTVTHRLASMMVDKTETALGSIDCASRPIFNALEIRARLTGAAATCTFHIFGRRSGDTSVKLIATVVATAGSQVDADGYYHATTLTVTSYWPKTITASSEPTGSGMCTISFDTMGWSDFWIGVTALSAGTIYFDYAGF